MWIAQGPTVTRLSTPAMGPLAQGGGGGQPLARHPCSWPWLAPKLPWTFERTHEAPVFRDWDVPFLSRRGFCSPSL